MAEGSAGELITGLTRVTLGGTELSGATVWARPDYVDDQGYVTVLFQSQGRWWQPGMSAVLAIIRSSGRVHEIPVRVEHEVWHGEHERTAELRLRIMGAEPWTQAEELLGAGPGSGRAE